MDYGCHVIFPSLPKGIFLRFAKQSLFQNFVATDKIDIKLNNSSAKLLLIAISSNAYRELVQTFLLILALNLHYSWFKFHMFVRIFNLLLEKRIQEEFIDLRKHPIFLYIWNIHGLKMPDPYIFNIIYQILFVKVYL